MHTITLEWKEFSVNLDKVRDHLKSVLSSNYDGLLCDTDSMTLIFFEACSSEDSDIAQDYWDNVTPATFAPTLHEIVSGKINDAMVFGNKMIMDAAAENIMMGITQAGKTRQVTDYLANLQVYLRTGSLYAAMQELDILMADSSRPDGLSPFITNTRLQAYKDKIADYLT